MDERTKNQRSLEDVKRSIRTLQDHSHDLDLFVHPRSKPSSETQDLPPPYSLSSGPDDRRIRLLELQSGSDNDQLQGRLITVELSSDPQYCAISYAWGDSRANNVIWLDGKQVLLRDHICAILKKLRQIGLATLLWVDAICIDQQDIHERNSQVLIMRDIYSSAQAVIIFVGEETKFLCLGKYNDVLALWHVAMNRDLTRRWVAQELILSFNGTIADPKDKIYAVMGLIEYSRYRFERIYVDTWQPAAAADSSSNSSASKWHLRPWSLHDPSMLRRLNFNHSPISFAGKQEEQYTKWITPSGSAEQDSSFDDGFESVRAMVELFAGNTTSLDHLCDAVLPHETIWRRRRNFFDRAGARSTTHPGGEEENRHGDTGCHFYFRPENMLNAVGVRRVLHDHILLTSKLLALPGARDLNPSRDLKEKKKQERSLVEAGAIYNTDRSFPAAQIVMKPQNQAERSCESLGAKKPERTAIPSFDFGYQRPRTPQLAEQASQMQLASTWVPVQTQGWSPSTVSSTSEDMEGRSNTTPESSASEGELSFTGELYSDDEFDEDLEEPDERLFVAIEVDRLLQNFHKKRQQETVHFRSCTGPNATSTSSRSSDALLPPESRYGSSLHVPNSKRSWRMTDRDDEDGDDREKRRKQVAMVEGGSESASKLFACPYSKYDSSRYSRHNLHEKHYRHCSSIFSTTVSRLKQHIYRVHKRPEHYCDRCFAEFTCHQHLANHIRQLSCDNTESPFDEKMTHDQASLIKRRSGRQSPSDAWFFIYKTLFPMSPLPSSPFAEGTSSPNIRSFETFFESQIQGLLRSFRSQVARRMPSLAERERHAVSSILEECLGRMSFEQYDSSHETSPNIVQNGYLSTSRVLAPSIITSVPIDEADSRLPEPYAASTPLASETADTNSEMNDIFEPQPASSSNFPLEDNSFGSIFAEWDTNLELLDDGSASTQSQQAMVDETSSNMPSAPSYVNLRDCIYDSSTQG